MRRHKLLAAGAALGGAALSVSACSSGPPSASQFVKDLSSKGVHDVDVQSSANVWFSINGDTYMCTTQDSLKGEGADYKQISVEGWYCIPVTDRDKIHQDAAKLGGSVVAEGS
jgi:hypothetical protein